MRFKRIVAVATLFALALVGSLFALGVMPMELAVLAVIGIQALAFAVSEPQAVLFLGTLTAEQVKEFEQIMVGLKGKFDDVEKYIRELAQVKTELATLRRAGLARSGGGVVRPGQVVTDDCAEYLAAVALTLGAQTGQLDMLESSKRDALLSRSRSILNISQRTSLSPSDIPLPVEYSGQVVALVGLYGSARRYGTVLPLGGGTLKLPQLSTDSAFGLIARSATVTEKSPQTAWVTFTAEKFGGLIRLPSEMEEDSIVGIGNFIADYAARQLAIVEDTQFFISSGAGSGVNGSVAGLTYSTITNSKVVQMASTKTHYSDATLANFRALRGVPDSGALRRSAYYLHPTFEQLLSSFNSAGDRPYNPNAQLANANQAQPFITGPTLDGFPIRWVDVMPAHSTSANVSKVFALFGDTSFQYLGIRGQVRFDTSKDAGFESDEILIRALERLTIGLMANGAVGGLETAAS